MTMRGVWALLASVAAVVCLADPVMGVECNKFAGGSFSGAGCIGNGAFTACPNPKCHVWDGCYAENLKYDFGGQTFYRYCYTGGNDNECCKSVTVTVEECSCSCALDCSYDPEKWEEHWCTGACNEVEQTWYQPGVCVRDGSGTPIGCN